MAGHGFDFLDEVMALNEYATIAKDGVIAGDFDGFMDSGSYSLNAVLSGSIYGGYAQNKITELAGVSSVGKTFFLLTLLKLFLEENKEGGVFLFESESAISKKQLIEFGIDVDRVFVFPVDTVQKFRHQALAILTNYQGQKKADRKPILIGLDSLGMLSTEKEMADIGDGKDTKDMTRAQLIKAAFRVITLKLGICGIPLIMTNHTYQEMGLFPKTIASGGSGRAYAASSTVFLSKRKEKDGKDVIGNVVHCKMEKGRITKENSMADTIIRYESGLDRWYGMVDFAIESGIWKKAGTRVEVCDGSKIYQKAIYKDPAKYFNDNVMKAVDEYVGRKFKYGSAFNDEEAIEIPEEEVE
jgi:RecA/RadA recombinase